MYQTPHICLIEPRTIPRDASAPNANANAHSHIHTREHSASPCSTDRPEYKWQTRKLAKGTCFAHGKREHAAPARLRPIRVRTRHRAPQTRARISRSVCSQSCSLLCSTQYTPSYLCTYTYDVLPSSNLLEPTVDALMLTAERPFHPWAVSPLYHFEDSHR